MITIMITIDVHRFAIGWIDQFDVFEIPSLFSVEFAVAEGISGATQADWIDYKLMYEYSVRHLNFDTKGYQGTAKNFA